MNSLEHVRSDLKTAHTLNLYTFQQTGKSEANIEVAALVALRRTVLEIAERVKKVKPVAKVEAVKRVGPQWPILQIASYALPVWIYSK